MFSKKRLICNGSVKDVSLWLQAHDLRAYSNAFSSCGVDAKSLSQIKSLTDLQTIIPIHHFTKQPISFRFLLYTLKFLYVISLEIILILLIN